MHLATPCASVQASKPPLLAVKQDAARTLARDGISMGNSYFNRAPSTARHSAGMREFVVSDQTLGQFCKMFDRDARGEDVHLACETGAAPVTQSGLSVARCRRNDVTMSMSRGLEDVLAARRF